MSPAAPVLLLCMAPTLAVGPCETLNEGGHRLIAHGRVVWENIGWIVVLSGEPALWAAVAGYAFWWRRVRPASC